MNSITTQTVSIEKDYNSAFHYISNPMNQKEWAVNFIKDISKVDDKFIAVTPFGEVPLRFDSDEKTGVIDIVMGENGIPTPTRLVKNGDSCEYIFTLRKPQNMPEEVWQNVGIPGLLEELETLKSILEK